MAEGLSYLERCKLKLRRPPLTILARFEATKNGTEIVRTILEGRGGSKVRVVAATYAVVRHHVESVVGKRF